VQTTLGITSEMKARILMAISFFCLTVAPNVAAVPVREVSGVSMPELVGVGGKDLRLDGVGLVKKIFFKVYVVGLYLEKPTADPRAAIMTDEAKRIVIVMLRDVSQKRFVQAVEEGIMRNSAAAMPTLRARLDRLEEACLPSRKGMSSVSRTCRVPAPWCAAMAGK
jgi:hypothetical protein